MSERTQKAETPPKLPAGVLRSSEIQKEAFARILLLGAPKSGKTTCLLTTLPNALLINCDQEGASQYAASENAEFLEIRVGNDATGVGAVRSWEQAQRTARELANAGTVRHIIVDTVGALADDLIEDIQVTQEDKRRAFGELYDQIIYGIKRLCSLPAHVWVVGHLDPQADSVQGVLPFVKGQSKRALGIRLADWVCFEYDEARTPPRGFLVGPQKSWPGNGRNMRRTCVVPPDACELLRELGFEP